jgi:hypothetical protein
MSTTVLPPVATIAAGDGFLSIAVAVAVVPLVGGAIVTLGAVRYPEPPLVTSIPTTPPSTTVATAVAVVPLGGGATVTIGGTSES